MTNIKYVYFI